MKLVSLSYLILRSEDFMADFNSAAYKTPINNYPKGQCTWYAFGRIYEKTGKKLLVSGNAGDWYESSPLSRQYWKAASNTVACWSGGSDNYGHVGVIEKVYQDGSLDYSEANYDGDGILNTSVDGKIMHFNSVDAMKKRFGSLFTFEGYLCVY